MPGAADPDGVALARAGGLAPPAPATTAAVQHTEPECGAVPAIGAAATSTESQVDAQIRRLRRACYAALGELAAAGPDLIVVVGGGLVTRHHRSSAAGSLRGFGVPFTTGAGEPVLPLSLTVGSWLVRHCLNRGPGRPALTADRAGGRPTDLAPVVRDTGQRASGTDQRASGTDQRASGTGQRPSGTSQRANDTRRPAPACRIELQEVAQSWSASDCVALGERLASAAPRVALLVMGDGAARKALGVPGAADPPAERYDSQVADALATADAEAIARLDPRLAEEYLVAGRAAWQVLAGAAVGRRFRGQLRYSAAPLDVSYFVASWLPD